MVKEKGARPEVVTEMEARKAMVKEERKEERDLLARGNPKADKVLPMGLLVDARISVLPLHLPERSLEALLLVARKMPSHVRTG